VATGKSLPETDSKSGWQGGADPAPATSRPGPLDEESRRLVHRRWRQGASDAVLADQFGRSPGFIARVVREVRAALILEQKIEYVYNPSFEDPVAAAEILAPMPEEPHAARNPNPPAGLEPYLANIYLDAQLLGREQEVHLFRGMNYLKFRAVRLREALDPGRPRASDLDAIERFLAGSQAIKDRLIRANLRLVVSIARKRMSPYKDLLELVSDGNLSLIRAVEKFDYSRGFKFSTYASWSIMNNFARSVTGEKSRRGRFVTGSEKLFEFVADDRADEHEAEVEFRSNREAVRRMLGPLDDRERLILVSRFGIDGAEELTLERLGQALGITKERVRQIESKAQAKLRKSAPILGSPSFLRGPSSIVKATTASPAVLASAIVPNTIVAPPATSPVQLPGSIASPDRTTAPPATSPGPAPGSDVLDVLQSLRRRRDQVNLG
jgi:RNA polymerase primary sigma factor